MIYGFDTGIGGLVYLGLGIGFLVATMFGAKTADQIYHYVSCRATRRGPLSFLQHHVVQMLIFFVLAGNKERRKG